MYIWSYDQKYHKFILLFSLYFSSLKFNLKHLKLTKMDITRFAMKLFMMYFIPVTYGNSNVAEALPNLVTDSTWQLLILYRPMDEKKKL